MSKMDSTPKTSLKKGDDKRKVINVALIVFAISIVVFAVIGALVIDNFSHLQQVEELSTIEEDSYKGQIDERLRFIALQDNEQMLTEQDIPLVEDNNKTEEPEEIGLFLENEKNDLTESEKNIFTQYNERYRKKDPSEMTDNTDIPNPAELTGIPYKKDTTVSSLNMKVVIGNYTTREEAEAELVKVSSQFSAPPFLRIVNGNYTLQVGAFRTPETAYEFVNSLRAQGYSARIIEE